MTLVCILFCPIVIWHGIVYIAKEHYCFVNFSNVRAVLWFLLNIYGIPLLLLLLIYLRITIFLGQHSNNQTLVIKQRQQRDLAVIRRIIIIISLLVTLGIPTTVLLLILYITGQGLSLFYRIAWFTASLSMIALSLSMVVLTPQLKNIVLKKFRHNRVIPLNGTVVGLMPMRI